MCLPALKMFDPRGKTRGFLIAPLATDYQMCDFNYSDLALKAGGAYIIEQHDFAGCRNLQLTSDIQNLV